MALSLVLLVALKHILPTAILRLHAVPCIHNVMSGKAAAGF
jgi:hypothetical protein